MISKPLSYSRETRIMTTIITVKINMMSIMRIFIHAPMSNALINLTSTATITRMMTGTTETKTMTLRKECAMNRADMSMT